MALIDPRTKYPSDFPSEPRQDNPGLDVKMATAPDLGQDSYVGSGKLEGRRALITGGDSGIGAATAIAFAREGADVAISYLPEEQEDAERIVQLIEDAGRKAVAIPGDLQELENCVNAVTKTVEGLGGIDILVNNAALFTAAPIVEITRADYDRIFAVNVAGTLFTMQAVARGMIARGQGGKIINMASQSGRRGEALVAVYCASKAAVISLTQSAGLNLIAHGINVNAIAPGVVDGEHWDGVDAKFAAHENKPRGQKKREVGAAVAVRCRSCLRDMPQGVAFCPACGTRAS